MVFLLVINIYLGTLSEVRDATSKDWLFVLIIAVIVGFIALFIYYKGLKHTKASVATISELAFPFSAVVVNWVFLDAPLSFWQIMGGIILLLAVSRLSVVNNTDLEVEQGDGLK